MSGGFGGVRWACRVAAVLFVAAVTVFAQLPTGTILGTVKDPSGALIAGATITAQNVETGVSRSIPTNQTGAFRLAALPVGHYDLKVEASGFKPTTQKGLVLNVGDEAVMNFSLEVGTASEQVVVTGEAQLVNTTTATLSGLVSEQKLTELPLNGRNFLDLVLLSPGVSQDTVIMHLGGAERAPRIAATARPSSRTTSCWTERPRRTFSAITAPRLWARHWGWTASANTRSLLTPSAPSME